MKLSLFLPDKQFYKLIQTPDKNTPWYKWEDIRSHRFRIYSKDPNPWAGKVQVIPSFEKGKRHTQDTDLTYTSKTVFKVLPTDEELIEAKVIREIIFSCVFHSTTPTIFTSGVMLNGFKANTIPMWLSYSVVYDLGDGR